MRGGDASRTGRAPFSAPPTTPPELWRYAVASAKVQSSPAVGPDGVVYVGASDGAVTAIDGAGALRWRTPLPGCGSTDVSPCLDAESGLLFIAGACTSLFALNMTTGIVEWTAPLGGNVIHSSPVFDAAGGRVFIGAQDNRIYAFRSRDGVSLWSALFTGIIESSPAFARGAVFVGSSDKYVHALNATDGSTLWAFLTNGAVWASPSVDVDRGVVFAGSFDLNVYALNMSTGAELWRYASSGYVYAGIAQTRDGAVIVGWSGAGVASLDALTGVERWHYQMGNGVWTSPALSENNVVIVSCLDTKLFALDASNGSLLWSISLANGGLYSSPALAGDGRIVVGGDGGYLVYFAAALTPTPSVSVTALASASVSAGPSLREASLSASASASQTTTASQTVTASAQDVPAAAAAGSAFSSLSAPGSVALFTLGTLCCCICSCILGVLFLVRRRHRRDTKQKIVRRGSVRAADHSGDQTLAMRDFAPRNTTDNPLVRTLDSVAAHETHKLGAAAVAFSVSTDDDKIVCDDDNNDNTLTGQKAVASIPPTVTPNFILQQQPPSPLPLPPPPPPPPPPPSTMHARIARRAADAHELSKRSHLRMLAASIFSPDGGMTDLQAALLLQRAWRRRKRERAHKHLQLFAGFEQRR